MSALLVPVASRSLFAGRPSMRVIDYNSPSRFRGAGDFTRQHLIDCPQLAELIALDATPYIATFGGEPGIVKGCTWAHGMQVFSENLKHTTIVGSERVAGGKIKFGHGINEFKEDREDVWEFCVRRLRPKVVIEITKENPVQYPLEILRPEDTKCPVCMDDLSGNVVACSGKHQVCLPCYNLLPVNGGVKKCPLCNVPRYSDDERKKVAKMNGAETQADPYFYFEHSSGRSSFKDFCYNEALFLYVLKNEATTGGFDVFRRMLMSSFHNFFHQHPDAFGSYSFACLHQVNGNERAIKPFDENEELPEAFQQYLIALENPVEYRKIFQDVAHTDFHLPAYSEATFYRELEELDGDIERIKTFTDGRKTILMREIYFRMHIKNAIRHNELKGYFRNILQRILNNASSKMYLYDIEKKMMN